jgi:hypothetical protein
MNSSAYDIKDYLLDKSDDSGSSLDLVFGTNLFVSILPETPDIVIAIFDTSGMEPDPHNIRNSSIQILVRGKVGGYNETWDKAEEITECVSLISNLSINATKYLLAWKNTEPNHVGNDTKGRPIFSCNFRIKRL